MALASLNRLLDIKEKVKSERVDNGGVMNVGNPKLFVFYAGSRDPNLLQVVRAKVYALLQVVDADIALLPTSYYNDQPNISRICDILSKTIQPH